MSITVRRTALVSRRSLSKEQKRVCTLKELLLELGLCDLNLDGLVHLLVVSSLVVGIVLDGGGEEGVDEGRLSEPRLASNLWRSVRGMMQCWMMLTMMVKAAPRFATILCLCYVRLDVIVSSRDVCIPLVGQLRVLVSMSIMKLRQVYVHWQCQLGTDSQPWRCFACDLKGNVYGDWTCVSWQGVVCLQQPAGVGNGLRR